MKFTKMHGCGNDYVYVNCFEEKVKDPEATAIRVSDRHFGIGSDGLILICPSDKADFRMKMYNADGSEGAMCGNGIRCVGKYVYDHGMTEKKEITVETKSGIKHLKLHTDDGKVAKVKVGMGKAILDPKKIPCLAEGDRAVQVPIHAAGKDWEFTAVSMGNPHAVVFVDDVDSLDLEKIGPEFEHHKLFPDRVNTEFIEVQDANTLKMRVWERGSGETLACGTGACASVVAAKLNHRVGEGTVYVKLLGGVLEIEWDEKSGEVEMTGPAETVFTGKIDEA